ncbi:sulfite exporter TauE/SafE family protein [Thiobacillus sp.]|uniref:sulfite exporter TauE/SafE family protein n=1 Tax=Thiobacillus sp. TaxID=924 RepID=UPI0011D8856F|nr:sulfite exporter TauE/SafE family protein [Thiobacillus sp.]MBC2738776.1 sulfite exporter TauE/SafE family protein [Thiobacillus sp.]MBC2760933.1 sulfite exporter TauE/SafE family protein [Thiobacillus sp.]TXH74633.1 MAG: sulfite exporter TauE/SafE family protein [Thiobacillus sp.]
MVELAPLASYGGLSLFAAYGGLGLVVGFVAGLLGVGGGLIIVPVLIMLLHTHGQAVGMEPQLALGTSLATILFTSLSSVRAHHRRGAVEWPLVRRIAPGIVLGTLAGAALAARMPATVLKVFFVVFLFYAAVQMWLDFKPAPHRGLPGRTGTSLAGGVIGVVSSWVGIGGGTLSVPFMLWHNVPLHRAIATSAAIGFPIAFAGAVGYVLGGWTVSGLPAGSLGFVYLPALAGIVLGSVLTAPLGARTAHRLPVRPLKRVFALLLFTLALRMVWTF